MVAGPLTMAGQQQGEIERLLAEIRDGDETARDSLYRLVYDDLRRMAGNLRVAERTAHTLQPTALVHEAYFKIFVGAPLGVWDRAYFFAAQARAMRQVLVEHARRRNAAKRPPRGGRVPLDDILDAVEKSTQGVSILDLERLLQTLKALNERQYEVVVLRFYGGLSWKEIATHIETSVSTVEKDWQACRAWLYIRLRSDR
jgi:RNA polymerase sigma factor (TIGR02999 family)